MKAQSGRERLHEIIFEADTPAGRAFDILLLVAIVLSVVAVMLDSVTEVAAVYGFELHVAEWVLTALFTIEYVLRLYCVRRPLRYAFSFFGIVDLLAVLPTYLSLLLPGSQSLAVVRVIRLVRVFRVLKLARFVVEADVLRAALRSSTHKIIVFLVVVAGLVVIVGSTMYLVEGHSNPGFANIPRSVYWAIVTVTTVGFGDITPETSLGRFLSCMLMIAGYGIIAVPTGIVTSELIQHPREDIARSCPHCMAEGHRSDAVHCWRCGQKLNGETS